MCSFCSSCSWCINDCDPAFSFGSCHDAKYGHKKSLFLSIKTTHFFNPGTGNHTRQLGQRVQEGPGSKTFRD